MTHPFEALLSRCGFRLEDIREYDNPHRPHRVWFYKMADDDALACVVGKWNNGKPHILTFIQHGPESPAVIQQVAYWNNAKDAERELPGKIRECLGEGQRHETAPRD